MRKVVLVTGSSKGIGASTIKEFASNNYDVVINYKSNETLAYKLKEYIEETYKVNALVIKCDIANEEEVKNMIDEIITTYDHIDVLVNNASLSIDNNILDKTKEEFMKVLEVNVVGTFLVSKEVLKKTSPSAIINISSTDGIDTYNDLSIDYCASKSGINMITKVLSNAFLRVKICSIAPNWVNTESVLEMDKDYLRNEMNRIGQKELIEVSAVSKKIYEIVNDDNIKSGSIIRIDG